MKAKKENRKEYQKKYQKNYQGINRKRLDKYHMYYNFINYNKIKKYNQKYYEEHKRTKEEGIKILKIIKNHRKDHQGYIDIEHEKRRENQRRYKRNRRLKIYNKYQGRCTYCGKKIRIDGFEIDHLIPKDQESYPNTSKNNYYNLLPACKHCNNLKGDHNINIFRKKFFQEYHKFYFER